MKARFATICGVLLLLVDNPALPPLILGEATKSMLERTGRKGYSSIHGQAAC